MRVAIRETGSILVRAPRDEVLALLRHKLEHEPGLRVSDNRLESAREGTYVLRDAPGGGTRVIHARSLPAPVGVFPRPREELRHAVQADLFQVQRLAEMGREPPVP